MLPSFCNPLKTLAKSSLDCANFPIGSRNHHAQSVIEKPSAQPTGEIGEADFCESGPRECAAKGPSALAAMYWC
jgi:hypothetical protein